MVPTVFFYHCPVGRRDGFADIYEADPSRQTLHLVVTLERLARAVYFTIGFDADCACKLAKL